MEKSFEELARDLRSWWPRRRAAAAEALGRLGDARAVEPLLNALSSGATVRAAAARALGRLRDPRAIRPLCRMMGEEDPLTRRAAAEALGGFLADTTDPGLPVQVLEFASPLTEPPSDPPSFLGVQLYAQTGGPDAGYAATQALIRLGRPLAVPLIPALRRYQWGIDLTYWARKVRDVAGDLPAMDPRAFLAEEAAVPPLVGILAGFSRGMSVLLSGWQTPRRDVVQGWADLAPHTVEPLFRLLAQPDRAARLWAAEALGRIGGAGVIERLLPRLDAGAGEEQVAAAVALGHAGDPRAVGLLAASLDGEDTDRLLAAASALCHAGAAGAPALGALRSLADYATDADVSSLAEEAVRAIERALRAAPAELEAAAAPEGTGTELEAARPPEE
ncbi:MAG: HEAT repeat domain-containing protein [Armatimonadetes bacterium]|nr:HEAT repeat domain-containing protein [Armatimonadota bacterium]